VADTFILLTAKSAPTTTRRERTVTFQRQQ